MFLYGVVFILSNIAPFQLTDLSRHRTDCRSALNLISGLADISYYIAFFLQALDQANLANEGLSLSIEEQLSALTLSELQTPDSKSTVYLNGTAFNTDLFEISKESTKVF